MATAWPLVRAQLAAELPAVVGDAVSVFDGPVASGEAPDAYLTVVFTPSSDEEPAGSFSQELTSDGLVLVESGTVRCELGAVTGDATVPDVFDTFDAIAAWVQADMTLGGVLWPWPGSSCTVSAAVVQAQTSAGAVQRLLVTFSYFTDIGPVQVAT